MNRKAAKKQKGQESCPFCFFVFFVASAFVKKIGDGKVCTFPSPIFLSGLPAVKNYRLMRKSAAAVLASINSFASGFNFRH